MSKKSFLVNAFEDFHKILFDYRKKIIESSIFLNDDISEHNKIISNIQIEIIDFIKNKSFQIFQETGLIGQKIFEEVAYIIASLSDEIFLSLNWDGRQYWQKNLIERKMFNTANSGEKIFIKIEEILNDNSVESVELAMIYFYCLALGFKGSWRSLPNCEERIKDLKDSLYFKIYYKDSKFFKEKVTLFPQVYSALYKENAIKNKISLKIWMLISIVIVVSYFMIVEIMYNYRLAYLLSILCNLIGGVK